MATEIKSGLEGVVVSESKICHIDGEAGTLTYRGVDIGDLGRYATYEETIYLLWYDRLPTQDELDAFNAKLVQERDVNGSIWRILSCLPRRAQPMEALRTTVSAIAAYDPDVYNYEHEANLNKATRLTVRLPIVVADYYHFLRDEKPILPNPDLGHAANFLYMLRGKEASALEVKALNMAMVLMADHDFNASTFAARVTASTLSDLYSAITTAIGTLKGPLHGGANQRAMEMLLEIGSVDKVEAYIDAELAAKRRIMGFGHRVYRKSADPRSAYLKEMLYELCTEIGNMHFYNLATAVAESVEAKKNLFPNVDFYTAPLLYLLDIPLDLFTPVFAISRIAGWTTHIMEQYEHNRLFRPICAYTGPESVPYLPIADRVQRHAVAQTT
ncbi:MAG: citrate synthase [Anaerolineae bacterium]|nr:citrate synthase [Anaerolineae bacterium]